MSTRSKEYLKLQDITLRDTLVNPPEEMPMSAILGSYCIAICIAIAICAMLYQCVGGSEPVAARQIVDMRGINCSFCHENRPKLDNKGKYAKRWKRQTSKQTRLVYDYELLADLRRAN